MVVAITLILFLCVFWFDFRPLFAQRGERKGMWLYLLIGGSAFVLLILGAAGVKIDLSWIFFR